jgi:hypothetical protein
MKILTSVVNNPTFIEMQYHTLKKHMKCEYEFIVFNDAKPFPDFTNYNDTTMCGKIYDICDKYNIQCISIPNLHHKFMDCPVVRCADAMNFMFKYMKEKRGEYMIIDSDMFLIDDLTMDRYRSYDCAIVLQHRKYVNDINYMWNGLLYFNLHRMGILNDICWDKILNTDVGGMTHKWLNNKCTNLPNVQDIRYSDANIFNRDGIYFIKHLWSLTWNETEMPYTLLNTSLEKFMEEDPRNKNGNYYCEIYDNTFLHYRAGGDWERKGENFHNDLTEKLKKVLMT